MKSRPDIYLMRHGQTQWNLDGRLQGASDSPLTELGLAQARQQLNLLRDIDAVGISSPQGRARQTARIAFGDRCWSCDPRLSEIGIGEFAGRRITDLHAEYPELFRCGGLAWYDRCPGGEGLKALRTRCLGFLDELREPTAIVTHGVTMAMMVAVITGCNFARLGTDLMKQGTVLHLGDGRLRSLGDAAAEIIL